MLQPRRGWHWRLSRPDDQARLSLGPRRYGALAAPLYPSPGLDGLYDLSDYTNVHPVYDTLRDFKAFLCEAHRRGIRAITEMVLNHTSDQHPWCQRTR
jgi:alpha amylase-like protein